MEKKTDFKALSNKAKVQYIWDYYRLHIIVGVAAVLIIGSVIHHFVTYREPLLNVIMINTSSGEATSSDGFNEFLDAYGYDRKDNPVSVFGSLQFVDTGINLTETYSNYEVLSTMIAAGEEDLFFGTGDVFLDYAKQGAFIDLRNILSDETLSKYEGSILYSTDDGETEEYPCAIELTDNEWLKENGYYSDGNCYFGVIYHTEIPDATAQFAKFLLE